MFWELPWRKVIDHQCNDWPVIFRRFLEENQRLAPARKLPTGHLALADVACRGRYAQALVLEEAGNYQAALDLMRGDMIMDIRQSDLERVERKLRGSYAKR